MTNAEATWAILADLHGNVVALDAILDECAAEGIDRFILPGDLAWGPDTRAVVEKIVALGDRAIVVRGNADREVADPETLDVPDLVASTEWCSARLTHAQREWLRALPLTAVLEVGGLGEVLICHGTPDSDTGRLRPDIEPDSAEPILAGVIQPVVICGHSHVRFDLVIGRHRVVNPGSVGLHYGQPDAQWATIGPDGVRMRTTAYDLEAVATAVERSGNPDADRFAAFFRDPVG
ncbi:MAG TPA: metallophosphoesterase family protein [Thermomicrobiales bacterium]|jgi:predicted phosphodiesterase|nr:metallophosphoesterase family protein [Thermomicrobiales bacterium]